MTPTYRPSPSLRPDPDDPAEDWQLEPLRSESLAGRCLMGLAIVVGSFVVVYAILWGCGP